MAADLKKFFWQKRKVISVVPTSSWGRKPAREGNGQEAKRVEGKNEEN